MIEVNSSTPKIKKRWVILGTFLVLIIGFLIYVGISYGSIIQSFLYPKGESANILILGKGGMGHDAPDLTDTILLASISNGKVSLVSLPRDIWVPEIRAKLNSAYYWGGLTLAKSTVENMLGQPIQNGLVLDFSGFKNIIDALGGISVEVKNSFTDKKYPIAGKENDPCIPCRYETLNFVQGEQLMDGETALKFVRSRNAEGDEGTDIAREERQQLVVSAIKNKVISPGVILNPKKLTELLRVIGDSVETDINSEVGASLARKLWEGRGEIKTYVIPEELLINPPISKKYDNQYVFISKSGSWDELKKWTEELLSQ